MWTDRQTHKLMNVLIILTNFAELLYSYFKLYIFATEIESSFIFLTRVHLVPRLLVTAMACGFYVGSSPTCHHDFRTEKKYNLQRDCFY